MGLFDIFRSDKWRCVRCGEGHKRNSKKCTSCGHTVLIQAGSTSTPNAPLPGHAKDVQALWEVWICTNCHQDHGEEPDLCKVCENSDFYHRFRD